MASPIQGTIAAPVKKAPRSSLLRSCERCRRRKIRCDDFFPCTACTRLGLQCKVNDDRRAERTQSFLEERVKRLESLLAQQEHRDAALLCSRPATPSGSIFTSGPSQNLRLQIPSSPAMSPAPDDASFSPGPDFQDFQMNYAASHCSSPVDFANSPAADLPPWSASEAFSIPDQSSFLEHPRRARSFPYTPGTNYADIATNFSPQDDNLTVPDIPTIEVTSWETPSHFSNDGRMNDITFNLPDLSVGSWSGPPSPSLTATSHGYGHDELHSEIVLDRHSRSSSVAYSERSFQGYDSLKPAAPRTHPFTQNRPRSRSDVLPQPNRYLDGIPDHLFSPQSSEHQHYFPPSDTTSDQIIPGADEAWYSQTFFERVHPYFPILLPQNYPQFADAINFTSGYQTNLEKFKILLTLAIGSQFQNNVSGCPSAIPDLYFHMAQEIYPTNAWLQNPSMAGIQVHLLLAIYTLLSTYSSLPKTGTLGSQDDTRPNIWMLNALLTASAIDLNLQGRTDIDESEQNAFISIYVLDKVVGKLLGKPNLLRGLNIDVGAMRRVQGVVESNRMKMDETETVDFGSGWGCVMEWYRTEGRDFVF